MNYYEAERKAASELKDILGWSGDPLNDLVPVCMALCDKIDKLEREIAKLKAEAVRGFILDSIGGKILLPVKNCGKEKKMTFEEAEKKLAEIAGKSYFSLTFERSTRPKGYYETDPEKIVFETTCSVYIHGYKWHSGPTWEDAFRKLYLEMHPEKAIEESPEV